MVELKLKSERKAIITNIFYGGDGIEETIIVQFDRFITGNILTAFSPGKKYYLVATENSNIENAFVLFSFLDGKLPEVGEELTINDYTPLNDSQLDQEFNENIQSQFNGDIKQIHTTADGSIFVVGSFTMYGTTPRYYIAKIKENGELDTNWKTLNVNGTDLNLNGKVNCVISDDDWLYLGGVFTSPKINLIKINKKTGIVDDQFITTLDVFGYNQIYCLEQDDLTIYIGGVFSFVGDTNQKFTAKISKASGTRYLSFYELEKTWGTAAYSLLMMDTDAKKRLVVGHDETVYSGNSVTGGMNIIDDNGVAYANEQPTGSTFNCVFILQKSKILQNSFFALGQGNNSEESMPTIITINGDIIQKEDDRNIDAGTEIRCVYQYPTKELIYTGSYINFDPVTVGIQPLGQPRLNKIKEMSGDIQSFSLPFTPTGMLLLFENKNSIFLTWGSNVKKYKIPENINKWTALDLWNENNKISLNIEYDETSGVASTWSQRLAIPKTENNLNFFNEYNVNTTATNLNQLYFDHRLINGGIEVITGKGKLESIDEKNINLFLLGADIPSIESLIKINLNDIFLPKYNINGYLPSAGENLITAMNDAKYKEESTNKFIYTLENPTLISDTIFAEGNNTAVLLTNSSGATNFAINDFIRFEPTTPSIFSQSRGTYRVLGYLETPDNTIKHTITTATTAVAFNLPFSSTTTNPGTAYVEKSTGKGIVYSPLYMAEYSGDTIYSETIGTDNFKPFVFICEIMNELFEQSQIKVNSNFFENNEDYKRLLLLSDQTNVIKSKAGVGIQLMPTGQFYYVTGSGETKIDFLSINYSSEDDIIDIPNSIVTVGERGWGGEPYTCYFLFTIQFSSMYDMSGLQIVVKDGSTVKLTINFPTPTNPNPYVFVYQNSIIVEPGQTFQFYFKNLTGTTKFPRILSGYFWLNSNVKIEKLQLPNMTGFDFFLSIKNMFNLRVEYDKIEDSFRIEPFDTFYDELKDYTNRFEIQKYTIEPGITKGGSSFIAKYQTDSDLFQKKYNDQWKIPYGSIDKKGREGESTQTIDNKFALLPVGKLIDNFLPIVVTGDYKKMNTIKPRIAYLGGQRTSYGGLNLVDSLGNVRPINYSPKVGDCDDYVNPQFTIDYENPKMIFFSEPLYKSPKSNLFTKYWKSNYDMYRFGRVYTYYLFLKNSELTNFKFSEKIKIINRIFIPLKITDYNPETSIATLLLIEYLPSISFINENNGGIIITDPNIEVPNVLGGG